MSTTAALARRVTRLQQRSVLGVYVILAEVEPDGTVVSWWDGMKGGPTSEEQVERLEQRGYKVCVRGVPVGLISDA